jgi:hypothetical protein
VILINILITDNVLSNEKEQVISKKTVYFMKCSTYNLIDGIPAKYNPYRPRGQPGAFLFKQETVTLGCLLVYQLRINICHKKTLSQYC